MNIDLAKDFIIPGIVNISCTFLCELFKTFGNRSHKTKIQKLLGELDYPEVEFNSPSFERFLKKSETKLVFKNYILYNAFKQKSKNKGLSFSLGREEFINTISLNAVAFVQNDVNRALDTDKVKLYFSKMLEILEDNLIHTVPEEFIAIPII